MVLERIIWEENNFVKESDGKGVQPSPIGPLFSTYHPESVDYVDDITDFLRKGAEFYVKENKLSEANAFQGSVIKGDGGGDFTIVQLYRV